MYKIELTEEELSHVIVNAYAESGSTGWGANLGGTTTVLPRQLSLVTT